MHWSYISNPEAVPSPALLIYPDRIEANIRKMIEIAGSPDRLRPHIKTHKLAEMIEMQMRAGIKKFKCATIAEAEMVAETGAKHQELLDVLLASQPVGPAGRRLRELVRRYPRTQFSTIVDNAQTAAELSELFRAESAPLDVLIDLDCGMRRTGIPPEQALPLAEKITASQALRLRGLHAYDGHLHEEGIAERTSRCEAGFAPVLKLKADLLSRGIQAPLIVAGGTPTFPIHARREGNVECSPGTCLLWDFGYADHFPDLKFDIAAVLLTRVVSKPAPDRLCADLGHKAIASENPQPRARFINLSEAQPVMHNEEHLVLQTPEAEQFAVGSCLYAIPRHICPTVALHSEVWVVRAGQASETWRVTARARRITI